MSKGRQTTFKAYLPPFSELAMPLPTHWLVHVPVSEAITPIGSSREGTSLPALDLAPDQGVACACQLKPTYL